MTTTTSRTARSAPVTHTRSRLAVVAAPAPSSARDEDHAEHPAASRLRATPPTEPEQRDWVRRVLGVSVNVHARGAAAHGPDADGAVRSMFAELSAVERLVAGDGSQLGRLGRGELDLQDVHPVLRELHDLCVAAHVRTGGAVDAWSGATGTGATGPAAAGASSTGARFRPGSLVTAWALDRAARRLAEVPGAAFAVEAGGDLLLSGQGGSGEPWRVEIEHPRDRRLVLATLPVHDGGVATAVASGGEVVDLRSGIPEPTVLAATVVGSSLAWSDVWARAAVAQGTSAVERVATLRGTRGVLVLADGSVHRWHAPE